MRDIAHPAPCPVPQCEDGFATEVSIFFNEGTQDEALIRREDTGSKRLLHLDLYSTRVFGNLPSCLSEMGHNAEVRTQSRHFRPSLQKQNSLCLTPCLNKVSNCTLTTGSL